MMQNLLFLERGGALMHVHLLRHVLTLYLDFALVLPGLCKVITRQHPNPRFGGAAERFR
jgi:hypothetical protein